MPNQFCETRFPIPDAWKFPVPTDAIVLSLVKIELNTLFDCNDEVSNQIILKLLSIIIVLFVEVITFPIARGVTCDCRLSK